MIGRVVVVLRVIVVDHKCSGRGDGGNSSDSWTCCGCCLIIVAVGEGENGGGCFGGRGSGGSS